MLIKPYSKTKYILAESHPFVIGATRFLIPKGFLSDGASIPKMLWKLIGTPFNPSFVEAAFVHDYLWSIGFDGKKTDRAFYNILKANGVGSVRAKVMYIAVSAYRSYLKNRDWFDIAFTVMIFALLVIGVLSYDKIIQWVVSFFI